MNARGIFIILVLIVAAGVLGSVLLRMILPDRSAVPAATGAPIILAGLAEDVKMVLTIDPARPGQNRVTLKALGPDRQPLTAEAGMALRLIRLDGDATPSTRALTLQGDGRYAADTGELTIGWWELEVSAQRPGRPEASTLFPLLLGPPPSTKTDPDAEQLLQDARATVSELRSWREIEQLTDGAGVLVITRTDLLPPDRMQYVARYELPGTVGVTEVIILGADRYQRRNGGVWKRETLRQPLVPEGYGVFMRSAERIAGGRRGTCGDEPCRVVMWTQAGGSPAFAGWIGLRTHRAHRISMLSPSHYMTVWPVDVNAPVTVAPPK